MQRVITIVAMLVCTCVNAMADANPCHYSIGAIEQHGELWVVKSTGRAVDGVACEYSKSGSGKLTLETPYKDGRKDGIEREYNWVDGEDGGLSRETTYKNGLKNEIEKEYSWTGELLKETPYKNGVIEGIAKETNANLHTVSIYKNGKKEGIEITYSYGTLLDETIYKNGLAEGISKNYVYRDGSFSGTDPMHKGVLEGIAKRYYRDGALMYKTPYKNGKIEGLERLYYESGELQQEVPYKNDKKEETAKGYYKNGKLWEETPYKNGMREGVAKGYYENGKLRHETLYKNDKIEGTRKWYLKSGALEQEILYQNDKIKEIVKISDEDTQSHCQNDIDLEENPARPAYYLWIAKSTGKAANGIGCEYYESGKLKHKTSYKNGVKNGIQKWYNEGGVLVDEVLYEKGEILCEDLFRYHYHYNHEPKS